MSTTGSVTGIAVSTLGEKKVVQKILVKRISFLNQRFSLVLQILQSNFSQRSAPLRSPFYSLGETGYARGAA